MGRLALRVVCFSRRCNGGRHDRLQDLRDSGSIEQDADVVLFIYRPAYYWKEPVKKQNESPDAFNIRWAKDQADLEAVKHKAELICAKQRNGPLGTVHLHFDNHLIRFRDAEGAEDRAVA